MIRISNVCCSYNKKNKVIKDLSLDIDDSKPFFILGKNGCGKTTLFNAILKNIELENGNISIDGNDINELSVPSLAKLISFVPQFVDLNISFKVIDYLAFGLNAYYSFYSSPKDEDYEKVYSLSKEYHANNLLEKKFNELSGGEKQIIFILRAIIQDTKYVFLDEPTSNLDLDNQYMFLQIVNELIKKGKCIICILHDPNLPMNLDCNVALMKDRKILVCGDKDDILNENNLSNIYGCPLCIISENGNKSIQFVKE